MKAMAKADKGWSQKMQYGEEKMKAWGMFQLLANLVYKTLNIIQFLKNQLHLLMNHHSRALHFI